MIIDTTEYIETMKEIIQNGKECHMLVTGNSMAPFLYHERDTIYFTSPTTPLKRGDMVFFQRASGQYVMHRIKKVKKNPSTSEKEYYLIGDNQTEIEGPIYENQIFARVTRIRRKGRLLNKHHLCWFFFAHIWLLLIPIRRELITLYRKLHK